MGKRDGKGRWLRDEMKGTNGGKKLVIYEKGDRRECVLHSGRGEPFSAPFLRVWRQKATKSLAAASFSKQLQDWMVLRWGTRSDQRGPCHVPGTRVRGQVGVVMRTAAESAEGPGRPFLASFAAEKGSVCPNRNP